MRQNYARKKTATRQSFADQGGSGCEIEKAIKGENGAKECEIDVSRSWRLQGMSAGVGDTEMRLEGQLLQ